jgi:hypothetical protein
VFLPPFVAIFREVFYEGYVTKRSNPVYKYKILGSKYVIQNMLKHKIQRYAIIYNINLFINILITCYTHTHTFLLSQDSDTTQTHGT